MTNSQATNNQTNSTQSGTYQNPHQSTTSIATTLVDPSFRAPTRSGTDSTSASSATAHSTTSTTTVPRNFHNMQGEATMNPHQAQLLRSKGTYTDSGRHSNDWLFGGLSLKSTVKGAWKKVSGNGNQED